MKQIFSAHRQFWSQKKFRASVYIGFIFLVVSLAANYFANYYVATRNSIPVADIILDNLPTLNVNFLFENGFMMFCLFVAFVLFFHPSKIPFAAKSIAVFIAIRSISISLTHLATPPDHSFLDLNNLFLRMTSGNDLFFSAHTGFPYLLALIFWDHKILRYVFIALSVFFGAVVLLGHLHYSIDVFAAYFITFGVYHITRKIFIDDRHFWLRHIGAIK
jgi:cytochrome b561